MLLFDREQKVSGLEPWQPASPLEDRLLRALSADDSGELVALVRAAQVALPVSTAAANGVEPAAWPTIVAAGRTWVVTYTSVESLRIGTGNAVANAQAASLPDLAARWPDHDWGLMLNPGLPVQVTLDPRALARLAAPSLLEDREADPRAQTPVMQKLLRQVDIVGMLASGATRVSGYCHQAVDVAHISDPKEMVTALGRAGELAEFITGERSIVLLRWPAFGLELYRNAYGGIDEASRAAVDGWFIEEPPFVGLGFASGGGHVIREYKVDGVGLPHGATICEMSEDGAMRARAVLDLDLERWVMVEPRDGSEPRPVDADGAIGSNRQAYRVRWDGRDYVAAADPWPDKLLMRLYQANPAEGFEQIGPEGYVRVVAASECDAVAHAKTICEWRDAPFQVCAEIGDKVLLEYIGGLLPVAQELQLRRVDRGVYRDLVPRAEVKELAEQVTALNR